MCERIVAGVRLACRGTGYGRPVANQGLANTFSADDWSVAELQALKGGQRISLVVPARNEAATVGGIVDRVRSVLMETAQLVDEILVIDSDSTDATADVASRAGATVFSSAAIRPDLGTFPGKGEAMWKSMFVTTGDLVVFMDADLAEWDTSFVPGLLGPLLVRPDIELVKGFYRRPGAHGLDGGRVTELVARPLIALFFPELAHLVQPLAGEWAIRRSLFESLRVPTGYAVELAALVDTMRSRGVGAIAQVDLGRRGHRHQELLDLGVMATQILAAAVRRSSPAAVPAASTDSTASTDWSAPFAPQLPLHQFIPSDHDIVPVVKDVLVRERPPVREVA
jgi:glucosyl-3-phosphoglycerate synthase